MSGDRPHSHPCQTCGYPTTCTGTQEENYDGWPTVICLVFHLADGSLNTQFLCEDCERKTLVNTKSGYTATIDMTPHMDGAEARVRELREEFKRKRGAKIRVSVVTLSNENGNLELQLSCLSRTRLRAWLTSNGFDEDYEIVNNRNENAVSHKP